MKTQTTYNTCINKDGKPDSKCEVRDQCPDDGSSNEKRKLVLYEVPT